MLTPLGSGYCGPMDGRLGYGDMGPKSWCVEDARWNCQTMFGGPRAGTSLLAAAIMAEAGPRPTQQYPSALPRGRGQRGRW